MVLHDAINKFYYSMTINELQMMNEKFQNITYNSLLYVDIISYTENCTTTFLAHALHISKSAVTIKINEMVKQGLIERHQSMDDKRVYYLRLNDDIAKVYREYDKALYKATEAAHKNYTQQEIDSFIRILSDIRSVYIKEIQNEK